jgi:sensor histidine kinase YesM
MQNQRIKRYLGIFLYASIFWIAMGVLYLGSIYLEEIQSGKFNFPTPEKWILGVSAHFTWSFLTTFLYYLIEKNPPSKDNFRWLIDLLLTTFAWLLIITLIRHSLVSLIWGTPQESIVNTIIHDSVFLYLFNFFKVIMTYFACTGIFFYSRMQDAKLALLNLQREAAEALDKQSRFQLQALQAQLSPHFLFNSLNSISGMARNQENDRIVTTVANLADLLRYTIEATHQTEVVLEDELSFTRNYLALQSIRFEGCFHYSSEINLSDPYINCPPFCIQTLVENVFSHTELSKSNPISISLKIKEEGESARITVENSPLIPTKHEGAGVALNNLRERLELLYGNKAALIISANERMFSASIVLPLRSEND